MMTIRHSRKHNGGYDVIIKMDGVRARTFYARDAREIMKAVEHYYIAPAHANKNRTCPLCRKDGRE